MNGRLQDPEKRNMNLRNPEMPFSVQPLLFILQRLCCLKVLLALSIIQSITNQSIISSGVIFSNIFPAKSIEIINQLSSFLLMEADNTSSMFSWEAVELGSYLTSITGNDCQHPDSLEFKILAPCNKLPFKGLELFRTGTNISVSFNVFSCGYSGVFRAWECNSSWVNRTNWAHSEGRHFSHSL